MKYRSLFLSLLFLFSISVFAQVQETPKLIPMGLTIIVDDVQGSSEWYKSNLNFTVHKSMDSKVILKKSDFYLELKESDGSVNEKELKLPEQYKFINGYSKFSFVVDNLKGLYNHLFINGVNIFRPISKVEFFEGEYFVITDKDGNYLQFISNEKSDTPVKKIKMKPFIMSKMVSDLEESIDWYKNVLGFTVSEVLNIPDHELKIGYIELNGFYFELIDTGVSTNKSELSEYQNKELQGFSNLTLFTNDINSISNFIKSTNYYLNNNIESTNFGNYTKQLNLKDLSENNIQIIN